MLAWLYDILIQPLVMLIEIAFSLCYLLFGSAGVAVLGVSLVVNIFCAPLYAMADAQQQAERDRQKRMERWVTHIKKHFKGNEQYMMLSEYYRQMHYNPLMALSSSISLLLQIPFFIAAYRYLSDVPLFQGCGFLLIEDLGAPDGMLHLAGHTINVLPVLMTLLNFASTAAYTRGFSWKEKLQPYGLALVFLVLLYDRPAALVMYWTCNQVFSLIKNLVSKSSHPRLARMAMAQLGVGIIAILCWRYRTRMSVIKYAIVGVGIVAAEVYAWRLPREAQTEKPQPKHARKVVRGSAQQPASHALFLAAACALACLLGIYVPASIVGSAPEDFMNVYQYHNIMEDVFHVLRVYLGVFLVWGSTFYALSDERGRRRLARLFVVLAVMALVNFMLFDQNLGLIAPDLSFDMYLSRDVDEMLINGGVLVAVAALVVLVCHRFPSQVRTMMGILCLVLVLGSIPNLMTTQAMAKKVGEEAQSYEQSETFISSTGEVNKLIKLSRNGQNVVVLFIDRSISAYLPYLLQEKPELVQQLDGFVYYPNTISFGAQTIFGSPGLYGGYEYTPAAMNERSDQLLVDKHNEALRMLPTLFGQNGYQCTVFDPPFVNYEYHNPDVSIYDGLENVKAYYSTGAFTERLYPEYIGFSQELFSRNLVFYSLFRTAPTCLKGIIYSDGRYMNPSLQSAVSAKSFIDTYSSLCSLTDMTEVTDGSENTFLSFGNTTAHEQTLLQMPEYEPSLSITNYSEANGVRYDANGSKLKLNNSLKVKHYHVNMAAFLKMGEWFDYLREQGVWDNTRIIIVSDHGYPLSQYEVLNKQAHNAKQKLKVTRIEQVFAMMLVKDFDAKGFSTSEELMTNADTPSLALEGLIESPTNPYTGNPIDMSAKEQEGALMVATSRNWVGELQQGTVFDTSDRPFYVLNGDPLVLDNWEWVGNPWATGEDSVYRALRSKL